VYVKSLGACDWWHMAPIRNIGNHGEQAFLCGSPVTVALGIPCSLHQHVPSRPHFCALFSKRTACARRNMRNNVEIVRAVVRLSMARRLVLRRRLT